MPPGDVRYAALAVAPLVEEALAMYHEERRGGVSPTARCAFLPSRANPLLPLLEFFFDLGYLIV